MKKFCLIFSICLSAGLMGQSRGSAADTDTSKEPRIEAQIMPEFKGGEQEMYQFLAQNVRYPEEAMKNGVQGRAVVKFVVNEDGTIGEISILKDPGSGLGDEAVRLVKMMPAWTPGSHNGEYVKVWFTLPIKFELDESKPRKRGR